MKVGAGLATAGWARAIVTLAACGLVACGCAARTASLAPLDPGALEARYRSALARRSAVLDGASAEVSVWLELDGRRRPGVDARLLLGGDDALRFQVASLFGTALDLALAGNRLLAYAPAERAAVSIDASEPPFGVREAGRMLASAWSGSWQAPDRAWGSSIRDDSLLVVGWSAYGDSITLSVGPSGLPRRVRIARGDEPALELDYLAWEVREGVAWPVRLECTDVNKTFVASVRVRRFRFGQPRPDALEPRLPADTRLVPWDEFADLMSGKGEKS